MHFWYPRLPDKTPFRKIFKLEKHEILRFRRLEKKKDKIFWEHESVQECDYLGDFQTIGVISLLYLLVITHLSLN